MHRKVCSIGNSQGVSIPIDILEKLDLSRPLEGNVLCVEFWALSSRHGHFPAFHVKRRVGDGFESSQAPHDFSAECFAKDIPSPAVNRIHVPPGAAFQQ